MYIGNVNELIGISTLSSLRTQVRACRLSGSSENKMMERVRTRLPEMADRLPGKRERWWLLLHFF
jgi:hypothetical protein